MNKIVNKGDKYTILDVSTATYPNKLTLIDTEDLDKVLKHHWSVTAKENFFYVYTYTNGKMMYLARYLMDFPESMLVDHKNRNTLINCKSNLRVCTKKENLRNLESSNQYKGIYKGVRKTRKNGGWSARIKVNGKGIHLGTFPTALEAAKTYNSAAELLFGEFACLNKIKEDM